MLYVPFSIYDFIKLANAKIGTNEPKLVTTEEDRGSLPTTQSVKVQTGISKTILRPGDLSLPKEKETVMEETTNMTAADPSVRLLTFLIHMIIWSSTASLQATSTILGHPILTSSDSSCLLKVCYF